MNYIVAWKEFDKGLNRNVEYHAFFEKQSEAIRFAEDQKAKGFNEINIKFI